MLVHWTKLIFCHCQVALCKLFTFIIISVHKGQFMKFQIEDIRRGGAKIWISFSFSFSISFHYFKNECMVYIKSSSINLFQRLKDGNGEQGWCSGESTCLPQMWPGIESWHWQHVGWVCRWFSPFFGQVFPRVHRFSPLLKNQQFQFKLECTDTFWHVLKFLVLRG